MENSDVFLNQSKRTDWPFESNETAEKIDFSPFNVFNRPDCKQRFHGNHSSDVSTQSKRSSNTTVQYEKNKSYIN